MSTVGLFGLAQVSVPAHLLGTELVALLHFRKGQSAVGLLLLLQVNVNPYCRDCGSDYHYNCDGNQEPFRSPAKKTETHFEPPFNLVLYIH